MPKSLPLLLLLTLAGPLAFLPAATRAAAQTPDTATLRGHVDDPTHAALAGARITVTNLLTGLVRTTQTNPRGDFSLPGLPTAGAYQVEASSQGFASASLNPIDLAGGTEASVVVTLSVAQASASVAVEGTATDITLNEPQIGIRLDHRQIEHTPLLNRRITFLPLLNAANRPAINQGDIFMNQNLFTTNGAGRRQQSFEIDGASGNDSWGRQTLFTNLPEQAVQEMTVLANSFSAEYGSSTGTVVNIVTRSGGDRLHGDLLGLYRPAALGAQLSGFTAASATSGNQLTSDQLDQAAASLSGKLLPGQRLNATHFFFAGEFSQQRRGSPVTSLLGPGIFTGHYRDLLGTLRLDRQLSPRNNAFLRANADGFYDTNPNGTVGGQTLPSVARTFRRRTYTGELGDTAILSPRLVNNLRLQFQLGSPITEFDPVSFATQFSVPIAGGPTFTSGTSQSALLMNRQYGATETLSAVLGKHELIAGGDWLFAHTGGNSKEFGGPYFLGRFVYKTCGLTANSLLQNEALCESSAYLSNPANVATYTQGFGNPTYTVDDHLFALFLQDNFHPTHRLTLNLGLRYERQTFTDSHTNFAPRVGFVFDPLGTGATIVRGGFGIYYSQIIDNSQANYTLSGPQYINFTVAPGAVGFPSSVAAAPIPAIAPGAAIPVRQLYVRPGNAAYLSRFFPASTLLNYPSALLNPYSEQYTFGIEQRLSPSTVLDLDYIGTHTVHIVRPLDVNPPTPFLRNAQNQIRSTAAANCTRPYWVFFYQQQGIPCANAPASTQPAFSTIQSDVNDGYAHYNALDVNLKQTFGARGSALLSYVWSHTADNVDPDTTSQNPNDANFTGSAERGNAIYDQRNRLVLSGFYTLPLKVELGGIASLGGGLPYNLITGTNNSGDTGASTDRPVINGTVVGRNTGRGTPTYSLDPFVERAFPLLTESLHLNLRAEAFNVLNHPNFVGFTNTYGNNPTAPSTLGAPLSGITNQLPARQLQFSGRLTF